MDNFDSIRNWLDLRGMPVTIPREGRKVGTVADFYYKDTNEVYALRVNAGIYGFKALASSAISTIERNAVTVANAEMLIDESNFEELSELPLGNGLFNFKILSESGSLLGMVANIFLGTYPPVALHLAAFQLAGSKTFSAEEVTRYGKDEMYILDQAAKRL